MGERKPRKEFASRGDLLYLWHPATEDTFSGYGLVVAPERPDHLVGLLMVDRPSPADSAWLQKIQDTFGDYHLIAMSDRGERGLACQMQIAPESRQHLHPFPSRRSEAIQAALSPLLDFPPKPILCLRWDEETRTWHSRPAIPHELLPAMRETFAHTGYGCLAAEADIGVVHVCHAPDADIPGFIDAPVRYQWQLIQLPIAPLIRLEMAILDNPLNPYKFESFLNVGDPEQLQIG